MELSGELHAPAALPPGKDPPLPRYPFDMKVGGPPLSYKKLQNRENKMGVRIMRTACTTSTSTFRDETLWSVPCEN
jgi:hypothetical protein